MHSLSSPSTPSHDAELPALRKLRLGAAELEALRRQGFVHAERRRGRVVYKLRFRCAGRQRVRYIGSDAEQVRLVQAELDVLQRRVRLQRDLAIIDRAVRHKLRTAKEKLLPLIAAHGYHFYGRAIRKQRTTSIAMSSERS